MELTLFRYYHGKDTTLGILFIDGKDSCAVLEDEKRSQKVRGETRIPAGTYEIKFRKELSKLTQKYRNSYDWFTWHLQLQNVPGFKWVYMHIGNWDENTDGCLLLGEDPRFGSGVYKEGEEAEIVNSRRTFARVYKKLTKALNRGETVNITII